MDPSQVPSAREIVISAHEAAHAVASIRLDLPFAYVTFGDEDGDVEILKAGKVKQVLGSYNMGISVYSTPVAKNGVLYVLARNRLFALQQGVIGKPSTARGSEAAKD